LVAISYPNNGGYSPVAFKPNLVYLTINGLYYNLFGIIESLSLSIEDNTPWPASGDDMGTMKDDLHPSVVNVSIGFKALEKPSITNENKQYKLNYNFRGNKSKGSVTAGNTEKLPGSL
jgi:hypothetical protein